MSKFNMVQKNVKRNYENAIAYGLQPELELYNLVVTSFVEDKYYESQTQQLERIRELIQKVDPMFVCQLAVYAREKMYLRSIPIVLIVEMLKTPLNRGFDRRYLGGTISRIISRVDEITEVLGYYQAANNRKGTKKLASLAKQLQFGIADAFNKFDEYQFAKYNRKGEITLKDALFLTHPRAKDENQQALFNKIVNDTLEIPYTWETQLSKSGNNSEVWENLIDSGKLGYMALLRNLRNILNSDPASDHLQKVADIIGDPDKVRRSKQLPMRFYSAYREISEHHRSRILIEALEKAICHSTDNIDFFNGSNVLMASDVSASMIKNLSGRSKVQLYDVGLLLSMLLSNKLEGGVTTGIFGSDWKVKNLPKSNVLANVQYLRKIQGEVGYATNGYKVLKWAYDHKLKFDKILFFTDCQMYDSSVYDNHIKDYWKRYKQFYPEAKVYFFNLAGYGNTQIKLDGKGAHMLSGWSEKVFDMFQALENGESVVNEIKKVDISLLKHFA